MTFLRRKKHNLNTSSPKSAIMVFPSEIDWLITCFAWSDFSSLLAQPPNYSLHDEVDWVLKNKGKVPSPLLHYVVSTVTHWHACNPLVIDNPFYPPSLIDWRSVLACNCLVAGWVSELEPKLFKDTHTYRAVFRRNLVKCARSISLRRDFAFAWNQLMTKFFWHNEWSDIAYYRDVNERTRRLADGFKCCGWLVP